MAFYGEGNMNFEQFFVTHLNPKLKNKVSTYCRRQIFHVPDFQTPANTVYTGIQEAWIVNMFIHKINMQISPALSSEHDRNTLSTELTLKRKT